MQIRALQGEAEIGALAELQRAIWGFRDIDIIPPHFLKNFCAVDNQFALCQGAFEGDRLIGFALCFQLNTEETFLDWLGVLPEYQNRGVATELLRQSLQPLMQRGIRWVRFTCDPLEARLAHLYFHNFHARAVGFVENYFHFNESHLHAGLPQDRLLCRVHLDGQPLPSWREDEIRRVPVPWDIQQLKRQDMAQARTWSDRIREALVRLITQEGYQVVDFERDPVRQQGSLILQPSPRPCGHDIAPG